MLFKRPLYSSFEKKNFFGYFSSFVDVRIKFFCPILYTPQCTSLKYLTYAFAHFPRFNLKSFCFCIVFGDKWAIMLVSGYQCFLRCGRDITLVILGRFNGRPDKSSWPHLSDARWKLGHFSSITQKFHTDSKLPTIFENFSCKNLNDENF